MSEAAKSRKRKSISLEKKRTRQNASIHSMESASRLALLLTQPFAHAKESIDQLIAELSLSISNTTPFTAIVLKTDTEEELPLSEANAMFLSVREFLKTFHIDCIFAEKRALDKLMEDDYEIEERMMLTGTVWRDGKIIGRDVALNDIVIGRDGHLRVVRFKNYVNDVYLNSYNADGIIISTPTGSTGYSLSAGGPVVSPSASMMIMTPIAPHTMNTRSIILSGEEAVTVEIGEGRHNTIEKAVASFDGDTQISMVTGDRIVIRKATVRTKILKLNHLSFVEVLRQKMSNS